MIKCPPLSHQKSSSKNRKPMLNGSGLFEQSKYRHTHMHVWQMACTCSLKYEQLIFDIRKLFSFRSFFRLNSTQMIFGNKVFLFSLLSVDCGIKLHSNGNMRWLRKTISKPHTKSSREQRAYQMYHPKTGKAQFLIASISVGY